ncbi:circularly permuted type 2 ATP-grasp protein [Pseudoprimorskyibacter insulae]|uniref:Uncharacterized protein n=1 Tax=Pseudoprimorskyibacter insulae TaxID=1695997 RepID=A0A2R8AQ80_9RHOB|nr:circularly permuted type 2 ATP-grasp protein [Pseudoprimorskyibacter insulae]SPF78193.1 hypothetical protein PRI8871_00786 [Pseudoprimorskyibacter insulae]
MSQNEPTPQDDPVLTLIDGYAPPKGVADELLQANGQLRPVWQGFLQHLAAQSPEGRDAAFARGDQYLHDEGVYYRKYSAEGSVERDWPLSHIPVIIGANDWANLTAGIVQRAELLEKVMADLYGPATLIERGLLPPELVAQNPEWLRPLVGVTPPSGHHLHFIALELGRSPDGSWFVLGDRTQAPSGAGFALENRVAATRVFREALSDANVLRLAGFFRHFRDALLGLRTNGQGRVGILTPGQHTDTYFEHAYIASYLGFMLLECEDLSVIDGQLQVRTTDGSEPISVLWRRLDSRFADPLELDETSALGTPGMVSALRTGALNMVNCLGSGVLETRAMLAFLPKICEALMDAPLILPNIATWWCGQTKEQDYVRKNLERMLIGPALSTRLPFDMDTGTVLGGRAMDDQTGPVDDWLSRNGPQLVGQEAVSLSTTPAMVDGRLAPRPMVLRVYAARTPDGWTVMPGGYARIGATEDPTALAMQSGGSVADVWVVSDRPVKMDTLNAPPTGAFVRHQPGALPARAADNLFWLGRNVERAEAGVRLARAFHRRLDTFGPDALPLVESLRQYMEPRGLSPDQGMPDGLLDLFALARDNAGKVRDRFSQDGWNALKDLENTAKDFATRVQPGDDAASAMGVLLRKIGGFSGLVHENMFRSDGWRCLTIGRALERAQQITSLLEVFAAPEAPYGGYDVAVELGDSVMTHRRRYSVETNRNTVIDLMALDLDNPRSLVFQVQRIQDEEAKLAGEDAQRPADEAARLILQLRTDLAVAQPQDLTADRFAAIFQSLIQISDALTRRYFS